MILFSTRASCQCRLSTKELAVHVVFRIKTSSRMIEVPGHACQQLEHQIGANTNFWKNIKFEQNTAADVLLPSIIPTKSIVYTYIHDRKMEVTPPTLIYTNHMEMEVYTTSNNNSYFITFTYNRQHNHTRCTRILFF